MRLRGSAPLDLQVSKFLNSLMKETQEKDDDESHSIDSMLAGYANMYAELVQVACNEFLTYKNAQVLLVDVDTDIEAVFVVLCTNYLDASYHAMINTSEHLAATLSPTPLNQRLINDAKRYRRSLVLNLPQLIKHKDTEEYEFIYRINDQHYIPLHPPSNLAPYLAKLIEQATTNKNSSV